MASSSASHWTSEAGSGSEYLTSTSTCFMPVLLPVIGCGHANTASDALDQAAEPSAHDDQVVARRVHVQPGDRFLARLLAGEAVADLAR
jgi:hypothetical protein